MELQRAMEASMTGEGFRHSGRAGGVGGAQHVQATKFKSSLCNVSAQVGDSKFRP